MSDLCAVCSQSMQSSLFANDLEVRLLPSIHANLRILYEYRRCYVYHITIFRVTTQYLLLKFMKMPLDTLMHLVFCNPILYTHSKVQHTRTHTHTCAHRHVTNKLK